MAGKQSEPDISRKQLERCFQRIGVGVWDLLWWQGGRLECCAFSKKSESYKLWQWLSIQGQSADEVAHCENIVCFHWQQDRVDPGDKMWVTREETVWGRTSKGPGPRRRLIRQAGQKKENGRGQEWQKLMAGESIWGAWLGKTLEVSRQEPSKYPTKALALNILTKPESIHSDLNFSSRMNEPLLSFIAPYLTHSFITFFHR